MKVENKIESTVNYLDKLRSLKITEEALKRSIEYIN